MARNKYPEETVEKILEAANILIVKSKDKFQFVFLKGSRTKCPRAFCHRLKVQLLKI